MYVCTYIYIDTHISLVQNNTSKFKSLNSHRVSPNVVPINKKTSLMNIYYTYKRHWATHSLY